MALGTAMKRVDPLQELMGFQDRVNQIIRNNFTGYGDDSLTATAWAPAVDIFETSEAIELTFELPGVRQQDIKVHFENNLLTVSGERRLEHEDQRDRYHRVERSYGNFLRSFNVPTTVDPNQIKAEFTGGLLRLTLSKRPESQPRAIEIQVK